MCTRLPCVRSLEEWWGWSLTQSDEKEQVGDSASPTQAMLETGFLSVWLPGAHGGQADFVVWLSDLKCDVQGLGDAQSEWGVVIV